MKVLLMLFLICPLVGFSTKVLPECDILFINNDTIYVDKIFFKEIYRAINKQTSFEKNSNPNRRNQYKAYWELKENKLYLLRITNCPGDFCSNLKHTDTLDLRKAFLGRYKNGRVRFSLKNKTVYAHKPFKIRVNWAWFPDYITDYHIKFHWGNLKTIDTIFNYKDDSTRLNRYSKFQVFEKIHDILVNSIEIDNSLKSISDLEFEVSVRINNEGFFDTLEVNLLRINQQYDSLSLSQYDKADLIKVEEVRHILSKTMWDEVKISSPDVVGFTFVYQVDENRIVCPFCSKNYESNRSSIFRRLPWYLKSVYNDQ